MHNTDPTFWIHHYKKNKIKDNIYLKSWNWKDTVGKFCILMLIYMTN